MMLLYVVRLGVFIAKPWRTTIISAFVFVVS